VFYACVLWLYDWCSRHHCVARHHWVPLEAAGMYMRAHIHVRTHVYTHMCACVQDKDVSECIIRIYVHNMCECAGQGHP